MSTYQLLDSGGFRKLEQVGEFRIVRPSLAAVWEPSLNQSQWQDIDAEFKRYQDGNGEWIVKNPAVKSSWTVQEQNITFQIKLTGFGHLGIFPEQAHNWREIFKIINQCERRPLNVLNLFAYTGGSTLCAAAAGAQVVHLDASKSSVAWGRTNAELSGLANHPIRWIVDDVQEFVEKELRRGHSYDAIILDPPSYGRGHKNQIWKIEDHLMPLLHKCKKLLSKTPLFVSLSSHSTGYTPIALENQLQQVFGSENQSVLISAAEMYVEDRHHKKLPSGASGLLQFRHSP